MSGSFWKFGQDYSMESNVSKLLNNAFIKKNDIMETKSIDQDNFKDQDNNNNNDNNNNKENTTSTNNNIPINEEDFENFNPNLDVLTDLVDDEELYTELMCSNFKLLMYLKYPKVLETLIDFITNEKFILDSYGNEQQQQQLSNNNDSNSKDNNEKLNLNQEVIILSKEEQDEKLNELERLKDNNNNNSDSNSVISQETSVTLPPETEEQIEFRRARMAAEILSADVWQISTTIIENDILLNKIWSILENHGSHLSLTVSTYFMKINERLLDINMSQMIEYLLTKENLVDKFLKHIDNPSLMDFLLKVISTDKSDSPTGVINLLYDQNFIPKLLDLIDSSKFNSSIQSSAADFIKAFVTLSANSNNEISVGIGPNELTRQLVSTEMIERLITIMLEGGTSLSNGVGIIIEIIRKNNSDYDFIQVMYTTLETHPPNDRDPIHLTYLIKLFAQYMPKFMDLLINVEKRTLLTPFGSIEPLGFERFKICELIAELLHCSNMTLLNEPHGESITQERDLARFQSLHGDTLSKEEFDILSNKLQDLKLENDNNNNNNASENVANDPNDETALKRDEYESSLEIYPNDKISVSSDTESIIRKKHIPGDDLKIALQDTKILGYIVDMFFKFEWNNFLHNVVFDIIQQTFNGPLKCGFNKFLIKDLLAETRITDKIIEGDERCRKYEEKEGIRLGYMGHLTLIAEEVAKFIEYIDEMKITFDTTGILDVLTEEKWQTFMDTTLTETREKYNAVLGDFMLEEDGGQEGNYEGEQDNNDENVDTSVTEENIDTAGDKQYEDDEATALEKKYETLNPSEEDYDYYDENIDFNDNDYLEGGDVQDSDIPQYTDNFTEENRQEGFDEQALDENGETGYYEYEDASGHKTVLNLNNDRDNEIRSPKAVPLNETLVKPISYHREDSGHNESSDSDSDGDEFSPTDDNDLDNEAGDDEDEDEMGYTLCRTPSIENSTN